MDLKKSILDELNTDRYFDDVTSMHISSPKKRMDAKVIARHGGVFSGSAVVRSFQEIFLDVEFSLYKLEGASLGTNEVLLEFSGPRLLVLGLERTLLNFLSHTSGVATQTYKCVKALNNPKIKLLATRKTLPGLRELQLAAVKAGGGCVHRRSLSDGVLIKDNHLLMTPMKELVTNAKENKSPLHRVECEVDSLEQLKEVLTFKPDVVMLDNMTNEQIQEAIKIVDFQCDIEVSGNVNLERLPSLGKLEIQAVSMGCLTHSVKNFDLTLEVKE